MNWENSNKPNFFLVGAAKSGTTSIGNWLDQHPEIFISAIKEPNYFGSDIDPSKFKGTYAKTLDKFNAANLDVKKQIAFVRNEVQYQQLFSSVDQKIIGECSTSYLFSAAAAEEIYQFNSDAKILMVLRNPIERAFSHYLMAVQMGLEQASFLTAFKRDMNANKKGWGISELYFELGDYAQQLKRYQKCFSDKQIKVVLFEDWKDQLKETQESICKFLNVSIFAAPKNEVLNKSVSPKNPKLHAVLMQSGVKDLAKQILPKNLFENFKQRQYKDKSVVLASDEREYLKEVYKDGILELQDLIKRDLSNWLK